MREAFFTKERIGMKKIAQSVFISLLIGSITICNSQNLLTVCTSIIDHKTSDTTHLKTVYTTDTIKQAKQDLLRYEKSLQRKHSSYSNRGKTTFFWDKDTKKATALKEKLRKCTVGADKQSNPHLRTALDNSRIALRKSTLLDAEPKKVSLQKVPKIPAAIANQIKGYSQSQ